MLSTTGVDPPGIAPPGGGSLFVLDPRKCGDQLLFLLRHHWILVFFPGAIEKIPSSNSIEVIPSPP